MKHQDDKSGGVILGPLRSRSLIKRREQGITEDSSRPLYEAIRQGRHPDSRLARGLGPDDPYEGR